MRSVPLLLITAITLSSASALADESLKLTAGTIQLGGTATFETLLVMPAHGSSVSGFELGLKPEVGYFVLDHLEITAGVGLDMFFGDYYRAASTQVGFNVGAKYYLAMELPVIPYGGASIGMNFSIPDDGDTMKALFVEVPLGALIPLNSHVAIDAGLRVVYATSLEDGGAASLWIPVGYFGVQAFF